MKKLLSIILVAAMLMTLLAACGSGSGETKPAEDTKPEAAAPAEEAQPEAESETEPEPEPAEPVEIVLWTTYTDHHLEALTKIIDGFNDSQDRYTVVAEQQPYSEFDAKLLQAVSNGTGPDLTGMFPSDAINYVTNGYLYPFTDFIHDPEIGIPNFEDQMAPGLFAEITQWGDGDIYFIPTTFGSEVLFYNKTMFDALDLTAPATWEDLETCAKAIHEAYGIAGFGTDSITDTFQGWVVQDGSGYIDVANNQIDIDHDIAVKWLDWFAHGVEEGYFRLVGEDYFFSNPFGSQAIGMYVGSAAGVDYVYSAIPPEGEEGHFEVAACPIPQAGTQDYISSWGSDYVCLAKDEEHARGAYEFLKYMIQTDTLAEWAIAYGALPAYRDAIDTQAFQDYAAGNIALVALMEEYDRIGYLPSVLGAATVRTEIDKMAQSVALGVTDAETAYADFVTAANAALNEG